jgi:hypothetical protein
LEIARPGGQGLEVKEQSKESTVLQRRNSKSRLSYGADEEPFLPPPINVKLARRRSNMKKFTFFTINILFGRTFNLWG